MKVGILQKNIKYSTGNLRIRRRKTRVELAVGLLAQNELRWAITQQGLANVTSKHDPTIAKYHLQQILRGDDQNLQGYFMIPSGKRFHSYRTSPFQH